MAVLVCLEASPKATLLIMVFFSLFGLVNGESEEQFNLMTLQRRTQPLYYCPAFDQGIKWRPPEIPNCIIEVPDKDQVTIIRRITIWIPTIESQQLDGYECYVKSYWIRMSWFFWGSYSDRKGENFNNTITEQQCRDMIRTRISPDGDELSDRGPGLWSTEMDRNFKWSWPNTVTYNYNDYYLVKRVIAVSNEKTRHIRTSAAIRRDCSVDDGICETSNGLLIWIKEHFNSCFLKQGPNVECGITGKLITCPGASMAFTNFRTTSACGHDIGTNDQGIYFTPDDLKFLESAYTATFRKLTVSKRVKRNAKVTHGTEQSTAAMIQFAVESLKEGSAIKVAEIHQKICQNNAMILRSALRASKKDDPSALVQIFYGPQFQAQWDGYVLSVIECQEIYDYGFMTKREHCMEEWPIEWTFLGGRLYYDTHVGYLNTNFEIRSSFTEIDCKKERDYFFTYENSSYLLSANASKFELETLPNPTASYDYSKDQEVAVRAPELYTTEEYMDLSANDKFRQEIAWVRNFEKSLSRADNGDSNISSDTIIGRLDELFTGPLRVWLIIITCVVGIIILTLLGVLFYFKMRFIISCCKRCRKKNKNKKKKVDVESTGERNVGTRKNKEPNVEPSCQRDAMLYEYGESAPPQALFSISEDY